VEEILHVSSLEGRLEDVLSVLRDNPGLDVNWVDDTKRTPLHMASMKGHVKIAKVLLAHPNVNVNLLTTGGCTPLTLGCMNGHMSVVRTLLQDHRVDATLTNGKSCTPLWWTCYFERYEVIEWLIASGRDLGDIKNKKRKCWKDDEYTVLEIARRKCKTEAVSLLKRFIANPAQTRQEVRVKLGVLDELAAEVFALTVFLCDGFLQLKPASHPTAAATRFFAITVMLPMELQMVLCHRAVGSMKQTILHKDSEAAFKSLARILRLSKFE